MTLLANYSFKVRRYAYRSSSAGLSQDDHALWISPVVDNEVQLTVDLDALVLRVLPPPPSNRNDLEHVSLAFNDIRRHRLRVLNKKDVLYFRYYAERAKTPTAPSSISPGYTSSQMNPSVTKPHTQRYFYVEFRSSEACAQCTDLLQRYTICKKVEDVLPNSSDFTQQEYRSSQTSTWALPEPLPLNVPTAMEGVLPPSPHSYTSPSPPTATVLHAPTLAHLFDLSDDQLRKLLLQELQNPRLPELILKLHRALKG
ncbi:hypothetical protein IWQ61_008621 [Dispira simplex]|nr:hypothetical protein IWQ61_008621 [Dispira simplex]